MKVCAEYQDEADFSVVELTHLVKELKMTRGQSFVELGGGLVAIFAAFHSAVGEAHAYENNAQRHKLLTKWSKALEKTHPDLFHVKPLLKDATTDPDFDVVCASADVVFINTASVTRAVLDSIVGKLESCIAPETILVLTSDPWVKSTRASPAPFTLYKVLELDQGKTGGNALHTLYFYQHPEGTRFSEVDKPAKAAAATSPPKAATPTAKGAQAKTSTPSKPAAKPTKSTATPTKSADTPNKKATPTSAKTTSAAKAASAVPASASKAQTRRNTDIWAKATEDVAAEEKPSSTKRKGRQSMLPAAPASSTTASVASPASKKSKRSEDDDSDYDDDVKPKNTKGPKVASPKAKAAPATPKASAASSPAVKSPAKILSPKKTAEAPTSAPIQSPKKTSKKAVAAGVPVASPKRTVAAKKAATVEPEPIPAKVEPEPVISPKKRGRPRKDSLAPQEDAEMAPPVAKRPAAKATGPSTPAKTAKATAAKAATEVKKQATVARRVSPVTKDDISLPAPTRKKRARTSSVEEEDDIKSALASSKTPKRKAASNALASMKAVHNFMAGLDESSPSSSSSEEETSSQSSSMTSDAAPAPPRRVARRPGSGNKRTAAVVAAHAAEDAANESAKAPAPPRSWFSWLWNWGAPSSSEE